MKNFWQKLKKPIMCSAPMSGVTNVAFRRILAKYGKPDVIFTEFVSCDGLSGEGKEKLLSQFRYNKLERPIVAQLFGSKPENFYASAKICKELDFDGIDINMGCPDKSVIKQKAGSYLIKEPELVSKIIKATKKGAEGLPVSIKTRLGYTSIDEATEWLTYLLNHSIATLSIHGRTKKQRYAGKVYWNKIEEAKKIAQKIAPKTLIIGNGNVKTISEAEALAKKHNLDGIMIGRALLSNPFLFNKNKLDLPRKIEILIEHAKLFEKFYPDRNFSEIKKFYKAYISGFSGANNLRLRLMKANNAKELEKYIKEE